MITIGLARIGNEPVVRYLPDGKPVLDLSLAYNYGRKDANGNYPTQWVNATLFGDRAEKLQVYLRKGGQILVQLDDLHIDTYQKKDGSNGSSLKARIGNIELVSRESQEPKKTDSYPF